MLNKIAQTQQNVGTPLRGLGRYANPTAWKTQFTEILSLIVGVITIIAGIWFIFLLLSGGIEWMSSGGDKGKLASARSKMFSGAIGLAIVVAALFIAEIFGSLIGLPNILNPINTIEGLP